MSKVRCYICGAEYDENPKDKDIHPKQCPDGCKENKPSDLIPREIVGSYKCKVCEKEYDNMLVDCPHCKNLDKSTKENLSDKYDLVQDGKIFKNVKVIDFDMTFSSMVGFMIKWALASIPALIILFMLWILLVSIFGVSMVSLFRI